MDSENRLEEREELNLLYVAMTRAQQAFILSGSEIRGRKPGLWYEKVRVATLAGRVDDPAATAVHGHDLSSGRALPRKASQPEIAPAPLDPRLNAPMPTGERRPAPAGIGLSYGVSFHSLMERLTGSVPAERAAVRRALGLTERAFAPMWEQAQRILAAPALARFFDPSQHLRALNEVSYVTESGELRRIDRLVEFTDEVWVLDYKSGSPPADAALAQAYREQLAEYRSAMQPVFPDRPINAMLLFAEGTSVAVE
jgi:ATP-dependent helicase/nuclease subunit A